MRCTDNFNLSLSQNPRKNIGNKIERRDAGQGECVESRHFRLEKDASDYSIDVVSEHGNSVRNVHLVKSEESPRSGYDGSSRVLPCFDEVVYDECMVCTSPSEAWGALNLC